MALDNLKIQSPKNLERKAQIQLKIAKPFYHYGILHLSFNILR